MLEYDNEGTWSSYFISKFGVFFLTLRIHKNMNKINLSTQS